MGDKNIENLSLIPQCSPLEFFLNPHFPCLKLGWSICNMAKENGCETLLPSNDIFKMKNTITHKIVILI